MTLRTAFCDSAHAMTNPTGRPPVVPPARRFSEMRTSPDDEGVAFLSTACDPRRRLEVALRTVRVALCLLVLVAAACATSRPGETRRKPARELVVTATAYNSTVAQTDSDPTVTAHGVRLTPGMRVIAVSRDLEAMGLQVGTRVQIEGLPGVWEVADRMPKARRRAIDVYMGFDVAKARAFGRRELRVRWSETGP